MRRASRALCTASFWASFVLSGEHAFGADDARPSQPRPAAAARPSAGVKTEAGAKQTATEPTPDPTVSSERAAAVAYEQALSTYATGNVKGAFDRMLESYRLSQRPELLYNLARLERELQECQAALEDYRRYLERVPNGRYRDDATQSITELSRDCPRPDPTPTVAAQPVPAPPRAAAAEVPPKAHAQRDTRYWTAPRVVGWSAVASGVVAEGGMLYFWLAGKAARDDFAATVHRYKGGPLPLDESARDRQHRDLTAAQVLGVAGGALITGGALVLILGPRSQPAAPAPASAFLYLEPGGMGAAYSRSF